MRLDDHMMTVITGLVLAVGAGILAQISSGEFGAEEAARGALSDDRFTIQAGSKARLDILANDTRTDGPILIVKAPTCGIAKPMESDVLFLRSDGCAGALTFSYCVGERAGCTPAKVALTVHRPAGPTPDPVAPQIVMIDKDALTPLPLEPVAKTNPEFAAIPDDLVEDAGLMAFAANLAGGEIGSVSRYLADTSRLDLAAAPGGTRAAGTLNVPLADPVRVAAFLRSYADTVPMPAADASAIELASAQFGDPPVSADAQDCRVSADLAPAPGAHLTLSVLAPCLAGREVVAVAEGLPFLFKVSEEGSLVADLPALAIDANVELIPGHGLAPIQLSADGSDILRVERSVVRLRRADGLVLVATEIGALGATDVRAASAPSHRDAFLAGRGYVRAYGSTEGQTIEVYTLPLSRQVSSERVSLELRRPDTLDVCAARIPLEFMQLGRDTQVRTTVLAARGCGGGGRISLADAVGDITVATR